MLEILINLCSFGSHFVAGLALIKREREKEREGEREREREEFGIIS